MTWIVLVLALALPDPMLTPGVVRSMTQAQVCSIKWGLDVRHVTRTMRQTVFSRYGVRWSDRRHYVVDHLVPRQLAGGDNILNLWPQPLAEAKRLKDRDEVRLHKQVCMGQLALTEAQEQMRQWGR
jgi:hypothetical protein